MNQADGPNRPSAHALVMMLNSIAPTDDVLSVAINAQTGVIVIETENEEVERRHVFRNVMIEV
jgi:hypothetical protein